jgi:hypothetical protein
LVKGKNWSDWSPKSTLSVNPYDTYFMESTGTIFYRSPLPPDTLSRIIKSLAESLSLQSTARVFEVDPNTVKSYLVKAAEHMDAVSHYLIHDLHLTQVQVDELWALVQTWGGEIVAVPDTRRCHRWVWQGSIRSSNCCWRSWWVTTV